MNNLLKMELPSVIEGGIAIDDRGQVAFVNNFNFAGVKRFYMVSNHKAGFVRAWHAHRHEAKYVLPVQGAAIVGAVAINNWEHPSKEAQIHRYVLSAKKPVILYIPAGYANGFKLLTSDAQLIFFSTSTIEQAQNDDVRFDAYYWDIWNIIER